MNALQLRPPASRSPRQLLDGQEQQHPETHPSDPYRSPFAMSDGVRNLFTFGLSNEFGPTKFVQIPIHYFRWVILGADFGEPCCSAISTRAIRLAISDKSCRH